MQRLIYTVDIDDKFEGLGCLHELLDSTVQCELGCGVVRSRLETDDEVCENGEWEDEENE